MLTLPSGFELSDFGVNPLSDIHIQAAPAGHSAFSRLITGIIQRNSIALHLSTAHCAITTGGVSFITTLEKVVRLNGLGGFPSLGVQDFTLTGDTPAGSAERPEGGIAVSMKVALRNLGIITLSLARLDLGLELDGCVIGEVSAQHIRFEPGPEIVLDVVGHVFVTETETVTKSQALEKLGDLVSKLVAGQLTMVDVRGKRARVYASEARSTASENFSVQWLDDALAGFITTATLQEEPSDVVSHINIGSLDATFTPHGPPHLDVDGITAEYELPYPIQMRIVGCTVDAQVHFDGQHVANCKIDEAAAVESDEIARDGREGVTQRAVRGSLRMNMHNMDLSHTDEKLLAQAIAHVVECEETTLIAIAGTARADVQTALGLLPVRIDLGAASAHSLSLSGVRSLRTSPVQYTGLQVVDATEEYLRITFSLYLNNPSSMVHARIEDSDLSMAAYYKSRYVGRAIIARGRFAMGSGPVAIHGVEFRYCPKLSDEGGVRDVPANFLSGKTCVSMVLFSFQDYETDAVSIPRLPPARGSRFAATMSRQTSLVCDLH